MGNAMTAVTAGDISTYYNPALAAFSTQRVAAATFGIMALDRYINFISYTQAIKPTAGISAGLINAGVRNIDGRDNDGIHTEDYSTYEDEFFLAFSNRLHEGFSLGAAIKLYHSKLFDQVKSTTVGFDLGAYYQVTDYFSLGLAVQDINSKYKWDTKSIYGELGRPTEDKFPTLRRLGAAFRLPSNAAVISAEYENSSENTNLIRLGFEYNPMENFSMRGGIDRWDFSEDATGAKPTFGFTIKNSFGTWTPAVNYAYVFESFAPHGMHIITISAVF